MMPDDLLRVAAPPDAVAVLVPVSTFMEPTVVNPLAVAVVNDAKLVMSVFAPDFAALNAVRASAAVAAPVPPLAMGTGKVGSSA